MTAAILYGLLVELAAARVGLGAPLGDEHELASRWRLWTIAVAIDDVAERTSWDHEQMALSLVVVTGYESGWWHRAVHDGRQWGDCSGGHCRSACLSQIHAGSGVVTYPEHRRLVGVDYPSTRRCVAAAARALETSRWQCRSDELEAAFAMYGTGRTCSARFARQRAWHVERLARRLLPQPEEPREAVAAESPAEDLVRVVLERDDLGE